MKCGYQGLILEDHDEMQGLARQICMTLHFIMYYYGICRERLTHYLCNVIANTACMV